MRGKNSAFQMMGNFMQQMQAMQNIKHLLCKEERMGLKLIENAIEDSYLQLDRALNPNELEVAGLKLNTGNYVRHLSIEKEQAMEMLAAILQNGNHGNNIIVAEYHNMIAIYSECEKDGSCKVIYNAPKLNNSITSKEPE